MKLEDHLIRNARLITGRRWIQLQPRSPSISMIATGKSPASPLMVKTVILIVKVASLAAQVTTYLDDDPRRKERV